MAKKRRQKKNELQNVQLNSLKAEISQAISELQANHNTPIDDRGIRARLASAISGGYDYSDTLHNIYLDYGYPQTLSFEMFWNMYRRFGVAKNIVELPVDTTFMTFPNVTGSEQFNKEFDELVKKVKFWQRLKGLDSRQRVGRYAGLFIRVRDNQAPDKPIEGKLAGLGSIVQMVPIYEGQLTVLETENDPLKDDYGLPTMYQFNSGDTGSRNEKSRTSFSIHPDRIIIAAEGADNGDIYGIPALEAAYNSLMDLRKIVGAGGEGFYKNAAQSIVFSLEKDAAAAVGSEKLKDFNDHADDFTRNRMRRSLMAPGMKPSVLDSTMATPKEFFMNALNDVAAACKIPATILIGQQTGRLASNEDSRSFLSGINSRRENYGSDLIRSVIDWCINRGILPSSEYEIEWDDLLALSDNEKLDNAKTMATINKDQYGAGGSRPFTGEEIREAAGYEVEEDDLGVDDDEDIDDDLGDGEED